MYLLILKKTGSVMACLDTRYGVRSSCKILFMVFFFSLRFFVNNIIFCCFLVVQSLYHPKHMICGSMLRSGEMQTWG